MFAGEISRYRAILDWRSGSSSLMIRTDAEIEEAELDAGAQDGFLVPK